MTTTDLMLTCRECGKEFAFTEEDQKQAIANGSAGRPSRCPECRSGQPRTYETPVFEDTAPRSSRPERGRSRRREGGAPTTSNQTASGSEPAPHDPSSDLGSRSRTRGHQVTCAECGTVTTIKFKPRNDRPVYCDTCYAARKSNGTGQGDGQTPRREPIRPVATRPANNDAPDDSDEDVPEDGQEIPDAAEVFGSIELQPATRAAVAAMGITTPTPIQQGTIPVLSEGRDVVGQARTGSGKTLAFAIPMVERIDPSTRQIQGLVLVPTRELAIQVEKVVRELATPRRITVTLLYGGRSLRPEEEKLRRGAHLVVGTPGRTLDHLRQGNLSLGAVRIAVLDEADEMLDRGFAPDVERILSHTPPERQMALFSATMPDWVERTAAKHLRDPETVEVDAGIQAPPEIDHLIYDIDARENEARRAETGQDVAREGLPGRCAPGKHEPTGEGTSDRTLPVQETPGTGRDERRRSRSGYRSHRPGHQLRPARFGTSLHAPCWPDRPDGTAGRGDYIRDFGRGFQVARDLAGVRQDADHAAMAECPTPGNPFKRL